MEKQGMTTITEMQWWMDHARGSTRSRRRRRECTPWRRRELGPWRSCPWRRDGGARDPRPLFLPTELIARPWPTSRGVLGPMAPPLPLPLCADSGGPLSPSPSSLCRPWWPRQEQEGRGGWDGASRDGSRPPAICHTQF
jgi:hypothetical protein